MKLRSIHPAVNVGPGVCPPAGMLVRFQPVGDGLGEAVVPDEVGEYLLSIASSEVEYQRVPEPEPGWVTVQATVTPSQEPSQPVTPDGDSGSDGGDGGDGDDDIEGDGDSDDGETDDDVESTDDETTTGEGDAKATPRRKTRRKKKGR
jgi:hypothetical protein